jgi:hypothetical protein
MIARWINWLSTAPWHWMKVSGQLHALAALLLGIDPPSKHWIGNWVVIRGGLDVEAKKRKSLQSNPGHTVHSQSLY